MLTLQEQKQIQKEQIEVQELFDIEYEKINEQNYIVLDKETILAKTNLSLTAQRIIKVVASMIKPTDQPHKQYRFRIDDFCRVFNIKSTKIHKNIRNAFIELRQYFTLPISKGRVTGWISYGQINTADVVIEFDPVLLPFYRQALAGQYQLINVKGFGCSYTFRFYELFCLKLREEHECEFEISIENLKIWLQIENKYKQIGDLRRRVIKPMLEDINGTTEESSPNYCNLRVQCEEVKHGKNIVSFKFKVTRCAGANEHKDIFIGDQFFESLNPEAQVAYTYFKDQLKVTKSAIVHCVNNFGQEKFIKIYMEMLTKNPNEIKNMAAYAATCLRNGYCSEKEITKTKPALQILQPDAKIESAKPGVEVLVPEPVEMTKEEEMLSTEEREKMINEILSLPEEEQKILFDTALEFAKDEKPIYYTLIKKLDYKTIHEKSTMLFVYLKILKEMNN